jgi:hypothetical protein
MRSTGLVLAAGGIAIANEVVFVPLAAGTRKGAAKGAETGISDVADFNWRIIPATAVLALTLGAFEKLAPDFAVALAGLALGAVLLIPVGNAPTPLENIVTALGY